MGLKAAEFVIKDSTARGKIKVAFFPGPKGSGWAPETLKGFFEVQRKHPGKIKLLPPKWGDTGYNEQRRLIEKVLDKHRNTDYIVGNAVAAEVAIEVLGEKELSGQVKIVSTYIIPTLYEKIEKGLVAAAPSDITVAQGKMSVDMMVRLLEGERPGKDFPFRSGPLIPIITPHDIGQYGYEELFGSPGFKPIFEVNP